MAYTKASLKRLRTIIREGKLMVARIERKAIAKHKLPCGCTLMMGLWNDLITQGEHYDYMA